MQQRMTPANALAALDQAGKAALGMFKHGSLEVEIFQPSGIDRQTPHRRDELCVVISGRGYFVCGDVRQAFGPGELLFVPAGRPHHFEDFSQDFSAWVMFYGPPGGEAA
ncbi:MAG TPA: cupin domain-containing protein [Dyella sp.]|nr:cupin domain-containing protein [Dyella sp.]